ncbi:TetR/AcrR family transcriptional regulator [Paenibacillus psychroresistens]|uniref:TetR/AcrR family transcriptional regulator n=1 Tax=Paenibacillus psychroresistens TaxID=1778678 RepID=A0A6B8RU32_9BACL|nr:TetR/AcrR family transcriptional regulator [Paenibacillus psychroresistens]QGQ98688.1 TetR/AcrR family transcriptional regulator [Paenibacillus psychroresistens]
MRHKDDNKNEAITQATIELLNEVGFSEISMSKIAKRAKVSAATIYVYFENKEDMLGKMYLNVKEKLSQRMSHGINESTPVKLAFELIMRNLMAFNLDNKAYFMFLEQFSTSPLIDKLQLGGSVSLFNPLFELVEKGRTEKILKPVNTLFILSFCYFPITQLAKACINGQLEINEKYLNEVIQMSWDAVKA